MRAFLTGAAFALSLFGAGAASAERPAEAGKPVVHLCERGNYAERMLMREHGEASFVTAAQVLKAADGGERWTAPRCMTGREYARLDAALRRHEQERRARARATRLLAQN